MNSVKLRSYAKLNLSLNITGVKDGYHMLDSFVCSINVYDTLILKKRKDKLINVYMSGMGSESIPPEKNNAVKAGERFVEAFGTCGADIFVQKDIPMGGGMGGSSADAAGVLNGMARLYKKEDEYLKLKEIADSLGSDTGYMLTGGFARMTGRGEILEFINSKTELNFLLIFPSGDVSTPSCFKLYDAEPDFERRDTEELLKAFDLGDIAKMGEYAYNALEKPAKVLNSNVSVAIEQGKSLSPIVCAMTGSGSTVFLLFESRELCEWAQSRYSGKFKTKVVRSVDPKNKIKVYSPFALTEEEIKMTEEN